MIIDNFFSKKLQKAEELYILVCPATKNPFIVCSEETYDDEILAFTDENKAKQTVKEYSEKKYAAALLKLKNNQITPFIDSLYSLGITSVVLKGDEELRIKLEQLAEKPDIEKMINDKVPRINPNVQLTSIYFLQEARRKIQRTEDEAKKLREMEEEMIVNLFRSRFIVAFDMTDNPGKFNPSDRKRKLKLICVKTKEGDMYLTCFSEFNEFRKFSVLNKKGKFHLMALPYEKLCEMAKSNRGIIVNPSGFNLVLTNESIGRINQMYGVTQ